MVAQGRLCAVLEWSPSRVIAILEIRRGSFFVGQIARGKYRAWNLLNQLGGGLRAFEMLASGDVAGANQRESLIRATRLDCLLGCISGLATGPAGPDWA